MSVGFTFILRPLDMVMRFFMVLIFFISLFHLVYECKILDSEKSSSMTCFQNFLLRLNIFLFYVFVVQGDAHCRQNISSVDASMADLAIFSGRFAVVFSNRKSSRFPFALAAPFLPYGFTDRRITRRYLFPSIYIA